MNKGFKVLSSVLAMSMVLASGVFAVDTPDWDKEDLDVLKEYLGDGRMDVTKKVEVSSVYEKLVTDTFLTDLGKYDEAFDALKKDVRVVQRLGDARCKAQFELDSANNELMAGRKLLDLAKGIDKVDLDKDDANQVKPLKEVNKDGELVTLNLDNLFGRDLLKADLDKLAKLKKENMDLQSGYDKVEAAKKEAKDYETNKNQTIVDLNKSIVAPNPADGDKKVLTEDFVKLYNTVFTGDKEQIKAGDKYDNEDAAKKVVEKYYNKVLANKKAAAEEVGKKWREDKSDRFENLALGLLGTSTGKKLEANVKALKALSKKVGNVADSVYAKVVNKLKGDYADEATATLTQGKLTEKAQVAAGKIHIIETFAKKHGFTLRACTLADYTAKASDKAASAEDKKNAKKDDVPNTASYFMIYVPTCQLSAPAVKYYGAAQVYDKVLRRPLVCENVKEEIVKVPMFTFDQITAYDVACCCCK